ncbi:MAG: helix-turn-helix domain-containing protein [Planctomycetota bacterium]
MNPGEKKSEENHPLDPPEVTRMFESVLGCKWSLHVLSQIRQGVHRPGQLKQTAEGLTEKVLNERLSKLMRFDVIERSVYAEAPPRVEYTLSPFGERFVGVLDHIESLKQSLAEPGDGRAIGDRGEAPANR